MSTLLRGFSVHKLYIKQPPLCKTTAFLSKACKTTAFLSKALVPFYYGDTTSNISVTFNCVSTRLYMCSMLYVTRCSL